MRIDIELILEFVGIVIGVIITYCAVRFWWMKRQQRKFLIFFNEELISIVGSRLPIGPGLKILAEGCKDRFFRSTLAEVAEGIEEGNSLAESLLSQRRVFPALYVKMVAIGEASGNLAAALRDVLEHLRRVEKFRIQVTSDLLYPSFQIVAAPGILFFLVTFIMPTFKEMLADLGAPLPKLTLFLISFSDWFRRSLYWIIPGILGIIALVIASTFANRESASFNRNLMRIPFFGTLVRNMKMIRFSRSLAMFLRFSLPLPLALESIAQVPFSRAFQQGALSMQRGVENGERLSDTMRRTGLFPSTCLWLASVGEERGNLEEAFVRIADFYGIHVEAALRKIDTLTVPVATLLVGGCVGCIVIGLFSALVALAETLL